MTPDGAPLAVVIELAIEDAPRVFSTAATDGQQARLFDWIQANDELRELVQRALELAEEAKAA